MVQTFINTQTLYGIEAAFAAMDRISKLSIKARNRYFWGYLYSFALRFHVGSKVWTRLTVISSPADIGRWAWIARLLSGYIKNLELLFGYFVLQQISGVVKGGLSGSVEPANFLIQVLEPLSFLVYS